MSFGTLFTMYAYYRYTCEVVFGYKIVQTNDLGIYAYTHHQRKEHTMFPFMKSILPYAAGTALAIIAIEAAKLGVSAVRDALANRKSKAPAPVA